VNLSDADSEHLVNIAEFLGIQGQHQGAISGVIYVHRNVDIGSQSPDEDHNLKMLSYILGDDAMKNVVVATDGWDQLANAKQPTLKTMFLFPSQFKRYNGTKLSALCVLDSVLRKMPQQFHIQIELGSDQDLGSTTAGQYLIEFVNEVTNGLQAKDMEIRKDIAAARRVKEKERVRVLKAKLVNLERILDLSRAEQNKLEAPVNWERAEIDSAAFDDAVNEWYESVTTDWKAKYHELLVEHNELKDDRGFDIKLRVNRDSPPDPALNARHPSWLLPFTRNEILWAKNGLQKAVWNDSGVEHSVYRARNSAGQIGWISPGNVTVMTS